jgi:hypothetical protein
MEFDSTTMKNSEAEDAILVSSHALENINKEMVSLSEQSESGRDRCNDYISTVVTGVENSAEIMQIDVYHLHATVQVFFLAQLPK